MTLPLLELFHLLLTMPVDNSGARYFVIWKDFRQKAKLTFCAQMLDKKWFFYSNFFIVKNIVEVVGTRATQEVDWFEMLIKSRRFQWQNMLYKLPPTKSICEQKWQCILKTSLPWRKLFIDPFCHRKWGSIVIPEIGTHFRACHLYFITITL